MDDLLEELDRKLMPPRRVVLYHPDNEEVVKLAAAKYQNVVLQPSFAQERGKIIIRNPDETVLVRSRRGRW